MGLAGTDERGTEVMRVHVLGAFRVEAGPYEAAASAWRLRKAASIVKLLALAPSHRLDRDQITDVLWPELDPASAANNLRYALHIARRVLDPSEPSRWLQSHGSQVWLSERGSIWVDAEAFESAARAARITRDPAAYEAALELYTGDLLPEDLYEDWAAVRRDALAELYIELLTELSGIHERRGELGLAIEPLRRVVAKDPAREEAHAGLMRLYALSGQRSSALRQYDQAREALRRELGVEPDESTERLYRDILEHRLAPAAPREELVPTAPSGPAGNLPLPTTSFVGREQEMAEVRRLLGASPLVTLTGFGGSGKTRLALAVAADLAPEYRDGAWFVDLAPVSEPELVAHTVATALGVTEVPGRPVLEALIEHLRSRRLLLVMDNCEHVVAECARLVTALLSRCPDLRVLATSREALRVEGEVTLRVPPLRVPEPGPRVEALAQVEAVRLFVARARAHEPDFTLDERSAPHVIRICRRLDGLPLAIELAAGRVEMLTVEEIDARLDDALTLLAGGSRSALPRYRTIRGTLDWSYGLLSEEERALLARLSAFVGGWTLAAAEGVCHDARLPKGDILPVLAQLVQKSLVRVDLRGREARYGLLEVVRQYAVERLEARGEAGEVHLRHARWFADMAERAGEGLAGSEQAEWVERIEADYDNLRSAMGRTLERAPELALRIASGLWRFWEMRGRFSEGDYWLRSTLARSGDLPAGLRAEALTGLGTMAYREGDYTLAAELHEESLALYQELGDERGIALALNNLGVQYGNLRDKASAVELLERSREVARKSGAQETLVMALVNLGLSALECGDLDEAQALLEECVDLCRRTGDKRGLIVALTDLGETMQARGNYERALGIHQESLALARDMGARLSIAFGLEELAGTCLGLGRPRRAASLLGAAEALREAISAPMSPNHRSTYYEPTLARLRQRISGEALAAAWAEGRATPVEQMIEHALSTRAEAQPSER